VSSFQSIQASLAESLRQNLNCEAPECLLELRVASGGSVNVEALLTIPDTAPDGSTATASSTVVAVKAASTNLLALPLANLTASLGVTVQATSPAQVATGVLFAVVVAPPPPTQPQVPSPSTNSDQNLPMLIFLIAVGVPALGLVTNLLCHLRQRANADGAASPIIHTHKTPATANAGVHQIPSAASNDQTRLVKKVGRSNELMAEKI